MAVAVLAGATGQARGQIELDLRSVELRNFVQIVAKQTGRNFIVDPAVSGEVTVIAPSPVTSDTIYEIFLNVLELNDLTIVEGDGVDRIVPLGQARSLTDTGAERGGAFETRVIPVQSENLDDVIEVVLPLLPEEAVLTPVYSAGLLVLSDRRENIARIESLIRRLATTRDRQIEAIRLEHASATDLVAVIEALNILPAGARLSADQRANSIVISGPARFRDRVRQVVAKLDTPQRRTVSRVVQLDYAEAEKLAEVIRQSLPSSGDQQGGASTVTVVAEPQSNSILINAPGDEIDSLTRSVMALDKKPAQVLIEAVIFEISAEDFSDLSVQFGGILNDAIGGGTSFSLDGRSSLITLISSAISGEIVSPGDGGIIGVHHNDFAGLLTAIASEQNTRLLSTPAVLTLNNQEAEIVVAQNVPFVTGSFSTVGDSAVPEQPFQTIERRDVGLTLKVRPQITEDNMVRMAITQEVSNLTGSASAAGGEITTRRNLSSNVLVGDGRVIILGGLMEESGRTADQRVPGLSNLPLIGGLFRGRALRDTQRVLLVMLRPRVLRSDAEAERVTGEIARRTEQISRQIDPRNPGVRPDPRRTGFPFDGVDLNQPFDRTYIDKAVRERLYPALPPRLNTDVGQ
ncbi:type II secretion system secretin GspD [Roseovarius salis]|uniref:type II secretion system secretin GspD n=1 Tax=Roseovarius salis TaxID=3376063 RepID=UPI0037C57CB6